MIISNPRKAKYVAQLKPASTKTFRSGCIGATVNALRNRDWSDIAALALTHPQQATNEFYAAIQEAEDEFQPLKVFKVRDDKPWMTADIKSLIAKRRRLFNAGKRTEYSAKSQKINTEIYKRKKVFNRRNFSSKNPKYWSIVKSARNQRQDPINEQEMADSLNIGFLSEPEAARLARVHQRQMQTTGLVHILPSECER